MPSVERVEALRRVATAGYRVYRAETLRTIGLDEVEQAFETMHRGEVLRSVVVL